MDISNERGAKFQSLVGDLLRCLTKAHPSYAAVKEEPVLRTNDGETFKPDFEIRYQFTKERHYRLIECQNRIRTTDEIYHKIRSIKSSSRYNRFMVIYPGFLEPSHAVRRKLEKDWISFKSFLQFADIVEGWNADLSGIHHASPDPFYKAISSFELAARFESLPGWVSGEDASGLTQRWDEELQKHRPAPPLEDVKPTGADEPTLTIKTHSVEHWLSSFREGEHSTKLILEHRAQTPPTIKDEPESEDGAMLTKY